MHFCIVSFIPELKLYHYQEVDYPIVKKIAKWHREYDIIKTWIHTFYTKAKFKCSAFKWNKWKCAISFNSSAKTIFWIIFGEKIRLGNSLIISSLGSFWHHILHWHKSKYQINKHINPNLWLFWHEARNIICNTWMVVRCLLNIVDPCLNCSPLHEDGLFSMFKHIHGFV